MHPARLDWVQPGALERQQTGQQAGFPSLFGGQIVSSGPLPDAFALMPAGIVPEQDHYLLAFLPGQGQQADNEKPHLFTIGLTVGKIQICFLGVLPQRSETGQRLVRFFRRRAALYKAERLFCFCPGKGVGLGIS